MKFVYILQDMQGNIVKVFNNYSKAKFYMRVLKHANKANYQIMKVEVH